MSSKSGASGSVRSCAGSVRLGTATGHEIVLDALYQRKRDKKTVRVLTVLIYVFCVSLAAIMLSLYYVFFWEPKDAPYSQRKVLHTVEKNTPLPTCFMPHTGRGDSGVNELVAESSQVTSSPTTEDSDVSDSTTEYLNTYGTNSTDGTNSNYDTNSTYGTNSTYDTNSTYGTNSTDGTNSTSGADMT